MEGTEMTDSLDGKVALVTGRSRGIGAAIADALNEVGEVWEATSRDYPTGTQPLGAAPNANSKRTAIERA
jgi:NAD(P)-dependent dehydrogenase (short-subunit alcohol dehydrogenase family)